MVDTLITFSANLETDEISIHISRDTIYSLVLSVFPFCPRCWYYVSQVDMFVLLYISVQFEDYNLAHVDCKMINEKISLYNDSHQSLLY